MPPWLLNVLYFFAAILYSPFLLYQMIALKKNRRGWRQRFGGVPYRPGEGPCIWIHAVSLGEVNATKSLVTEIEATLPEFEIVISATTDTGFTAAQTLYPHKLIFRYPLDFSFVIRRVFHRIRPNAIILMELEVWPNLIRLATEQGIPVGIANGRITEEKSMRRFSKPFIRDVARTMFSQISWAAVQNEIYEARFIALGVQPDRIRITGSMKYDTAVVTDAVPGADDLAGAMGIDRHSALIVAGSTGPGEEDVLLRAYTRLRLEIPKIQLAIIPRRPERFNEVSRALETRGHAVKRRSRNMDPGGPDPDVIVPTDVSNASGHLSRDRSTVFLGDTMGELRKFYSLADVVFVGRTLVPLGGSDLMEVAGLGKPMCFGPHMENFAEVAAKLLGDRAALQFFKDDDLVPTLRLLLQDRDMAASMGERAKNVVLQNRGATRRTVDMLCRVLGQYAEAVHEDEMVA
ncbi:MAG TPA: 3-deoxy-D-manno-octulosonic acid transferase [Phycisphaerae bacterium]|nr:3-deoxy-D-manno-octulosonic acid transferase [Phycisphaerae bacterium]